MRASTLILTCAIYGASSWLHAGDLQAQREAAQAVTESLFERLNGALQDAMREGGPSAAVQVCRDQAPAIKNQLSLEHGWRVSRVGTRVRNPLLGQPDAWEREGLREFVRRQADGEALPGMFRETVEEDDDLRQYRYMQAIGTQPACLACHGGDEQIGDDIRAMLHQQYPHDTATGYRAGELRGAFTISMPLD